MPTIMPRIIKLQYSAVLKSFFGNLKRRENKRNINEAIKGAIIAPTMLKDKIKITDDVLFNKSILFTKKFYFIKCGPSQLFHEFPNSFSVKRFLFNCQPTFEGYLCFI